MGEVSDIGAKAETKHETEWHIFFISTSCRLGVGASKVPHRDLFRPPQIPFWDVLNFCQLKLKFAVLDIVGVTIDGLL